MIARHHEQPETPPAIERWVVTGAGIRAEIRVEDSFPQLKFSDGSSSYVDLDCPQEFVGGPSALRRVSRWTVGELGELIEALTEARDQAQATGR